MFNSKYSIADCRFSNRFDTDYKILAKILTNVTDTDMKKIKADNNRQKADKQETNKRQTTDKQQTNSKQTKDKNQTNKKQTADKKQPNVVTCL